MSDVTFECLQNLLSLHFRILPHRKHRSTVLLQNKIQNAIILCIADPVTLNEKSSCLSPFNFFIINIAL